MKHTVKKVSAFVMAMAMLMGTAPANTPVCDMFSGDVMTAHAEVIYSGNCGIAGHENDVNWTLDDNGTLTISGSGEIAGNHGFGEGKSKGWSSYINKITSVVIEDGATGIGEHAFDASSSLTSVTIPYSMKSIGDYAFDRCSSLTSVTISDEVTSIGLCAFRLCNKLESFTIPNSVTSIGDSAFLSCSSLTSVNIPNGVTSIENNTFMDCINLSNVTIPDSVTSIGEYAFSGCTGLTSVTIPEGVTSIDVYTFGGCSSLNSVTLPDSLTSISFWAFAGCRSLTSVILPDSLSGIGPYAFSDCGLTSVIIPSSVKGIYDGAFEGCSDLTSVIVESEMPPKVSSNAFNGTHPDLKIYVPAKAVDVYKEAENWSVYASIIMPIMPRTIASGYCGAEEDGYSMKWTLDSDGTLTISGNGGIAGDNGASYAVWGFTNYVDKITSVVIEDGATSIGESTFVNCVNMTSISIPDSVTSIGSRAFERCINLTSVSIPDSVTSIGDFAFDRCWRLASVDIPDSVTSIGGYAFCECNGLTSITIPNGIKSIKYNTFFECSSLASVTIPDSVTSIGDFAFCDCSSLESVIIPDGVTSIGDYAFKGCSKLESVIIPDSVTSIGEYAFSGCTGLTSVTIPDSITSIGKCTFAGCSSLNSVTLPDSVTSISERAFAGCSSLKSLILPDSLSGIGPYSFSDCGLTSVIIPSGIKEMRGTFGGCKDLITIIFESETPPKIGSREFGEIRSGMRIYVPTEAVDVYKEAENWSYYALIIKPRMIDSGNCGTEDHENDVTWSLDITGTLTISGSGSVANDSDWSKYSNEITRVVIEEGVTGIELGSFNECSNLNSFTFNNPQCHISTLNYNNSDVAETGLCTVIGYKGSTAEEFASQYDYSFEAIYVPLKGDVNCDGDMDMADVVLIMQALANPNKFGLKGTDEHHLTKQGEFNGDMNGDGLTVGDALTIQRILLGLEDKNVDSSVKPS